MDFINFFSGPLEKRLALAFFFGRLVPFYFFFVWEMALESRSSIYPAFVLQSSVSSQKWDVGLPFPTSAYLTCIIESSPRIANTILCFLLSDARRPSGVVVCDFEMVRESSNTRDGAKQYIGICLEV